MKEPVKRYLFRRAPNKVPCSPRQFTKVDDTLGVVHTERGMDVTLRYAFPADNLEPAPLSTILMLVVSTASQLRTDLLASAE